jgi:hypothetical protein
LEFALDESWLPLSMPLFMQLLLFDDGELVSEADGDSQYPAPSPDDPLSLKLLIESHISSPFIVYQGYGNG